MGISASKQQQTDDTVVCIDCDRKTQKDLPSSDGLSSEGMPCDNIYANVVACMDEHKGQIAPCTKQWDEFKACHSKYLREKGI